MPQGIWNQYICTADSSGGYHVDSATYWSIIDKNSHQVHGRKKISR